MGALTRAYDWAAHPLGRPEAWPQPLRTAMRLILKHRPSDVYMVGRRTLLLL